MLAHAPEGKGAPPETADITAAPLLPQRQLMGRPPIPSEAVLICVGARA